MKSRVPTGSQFLRSGLVFVLALHCTSVLHAQDGLYAGQVLISTEPADHAQLAFVIERAEVVLNDHPGVGPLQVVLPESKLRELRAAGLRYRVVERDLDRVFAAERERLSHQPALYAADPATFLQDFRSGSEVDAHLDTLAALAPERVTLVDVGKSVENRPIRALRISADSRERPAFVLIGTQHAREWVSTMVSVCLADAFIRRYDTNPAIKLIQERLAIVIAPLVNPDGYEYSRTKDRLWRKNRRAGGGGTDLNRNWDQGWQTARGPSASSELYPGPMAFSEPESKAVADLLGRLPKVAAFLDIHTDGQMVVYPLAYTSTPAPNGAEILEWANTMARAMTAVNRVNHHIERAGQTDPTGGLAQDYATMKNGVVGLTMELRQGTSSQGFGDRPANIAPTCEEALAGFLSVAVPLAEKTALPVADAGTMPADSGASDAGASDAGASDASPLHEGGIASLDAGTMDATSAPSDAGAMPTADASLQGTNDSAVPSAGSGATPPDAGRSAAVLGGDAALPVPTGHAADGDGGCSVRAPGTSRSALGRVLVLLALGGLAVRRRSAQTSIRTHRAPTITRPL